MKKVRPRYKFLGDIPTKEFYQNKQKGGSISELGYSKNSPYKDNPYLDIHTPNGSITMENTEFPLLGVDETGVQQIMYPGGNYRFPGKKVREIPFQQGGTYPTSTPQQRGNWNNFLLYLKQNNISGSKDLDSKDQSLGLSYLDKYNQVYGDKKVDKDFIPIAQYESGQLKQGQIPDIGQVDNFPLPSSYRTRNTSPVDSWLGSLTSSNTSYPVVTKHGGDGDYDFGTDYKAYQGFLKDPSTGAKYLRKQPQPIVTAGTYQMGGLSRSDTERRIAVEDRLHNQRMQASQPTLSQYTPQLGDTQRMNDNRTNYLREQNAPLNRAASSKIATNTMNNIVEPLATVGATMDGIAGLRGLLRGAGASQAVTRGPIDWGNAVSTTTNPGFDARAYEATIKSPYVAPIQGEGAPYIRGNNAFSHSDLSTYLHGNDFNYVNMGEKPIKGQGYGVDPEDLMNGSWRNDAGQVAGKWINENRMTTPDRVGELLKTLPKNRLGGYQRGGLSSRVYHFLNDDDDEEDNKLEVTQNTAPDTTELEQTAPPEQEEDDLAMSVATANYEQPSAPVNPIIGQYGEEIQKELSASLGYAPHYNSVFRTSAQQDALIKQGLGVKNSFHLTGDAVDLKPEDWNKLGAQKQQFFRSKYDVINHNNHYHIEPKGSPSQYQMGGVYEGISYDELDRLKKQGYKFNFLD